MIRPKAFMIVLQNGRRSDTSEGPLRKAKLLRGEECTEPPMASDGKLKSYRRRARTPTDTRETAVNYVGGYVVSAVSGVSAGVGRGGISTPYGPPTRTRF